MKTLKKLISVLIFCTLLLSLAACGGSNSDTSATASADAASTPSADTGSTASGDTSSGSSDIDEAMKEVDDILANYQSPSFATQENYESIPDTTVLKGKKVMVMPYDATNDFANNIAKSLKAVYEFLGAEVFIYNADGTADSWISGISAAVNQKYDILDICGGAALENLESQLDEARAAGVYVQDTHNTVVEVQYPDDVSIGANLTLMAQLEAYQTIKDVGDPSKVNCLVIADAGIISDDYMKNGITGVFDKYNVKYTIKDVAITDWTTGIAEQVRTAFIADPSYNAVIAYYDNMLLYVVPAMEEMGCDFDNIVVGSYNGSPNVLSYISDDKIDFDIGESVAWTALQAVDCCLRYFNDMTPHNTDGFGCYMITPENVKNCLDPNTGEGSYAYDGAQDVYIPGYSKLWGIDLTGVFDNAY